MPQLQVLQRMDDQSAQAIKSAGENFAEGLFKKQQLAIWKLDAQTRAKLADSEEAKGKADREVQFVDTLGKYADGGLINDKNAPQVMSNLARHFGVEESMDFLHNGSLAINFKTTKGRLEEAQAEEANAKAKLASSTSYLMNQMMPQQGQDAQAPAIPGGISAGATPRLGAMGGLGNGMQMSEMGMDLGPLSLKFNNPQQIAKQKEVDAAATARGTEMTKKFINKEEFDNYLTAFDALNTQLPRNSAVNNAGAGILQRVKRNVQLSIEGMGQTKGIGTVVNAYQPAAMRLGVGIARRQDVGNLSQTEQNAARLLVPTIDDTKEVAALKMAFIHDVARMPDSGDPSAVRALLKQTQMALGAIKNPDAPAAKSYNRVQTIQGASPMQVPNKYVDTGVDSATGKKYGKLPDGTVEEIQ